MREIPQNLPSIYFDSNGLVSFDLGKSFEFSETKVAEALSSLSKITNEAVKEFSLPFTDKNEAIIAEYWSLNQLQSSYFTIPVTVLIGSRVSSQNVLIVSEKIDTEQNYKVSVTNANTNWKTQLKDCQLCSLEYPTFKWTEANLADNWANEAEYLGTSNKGYYFPLVNFGKFSGIDDQGDTDPTNDKVVAAVEDFRPQFHLLPMLEKAFCKVGYAFKCPILETSVGRRIGQYLIGDIRKTENAKAFNSKYCVRQAYTFVAQGSSPVLPIQFGGLLFTQPEYDASNLFTVTNPANDSYFSGVSGEYCLKITITAQKTNNFPSTIQIQTVHNNVAGTTAIDSDISESFTIAPNFPITYEFTSKAFTVTDAGQRLRAVLVTTIGDDNIEILTPTCIELIPKNAKLAENIELNPALLIDPKLMAFDILEAFTHLIRGRFVTDEINREVTLYSPYATEVFGETVEPFYKIAEGQKQLNENSEVVCKSGKYTIHPKNLKRFFAIGYPSPDDKYVESLGFSDENPFLGEIFDQGNAPNLDLETEEEFNPLYEGTANVGVTTITEGSATLVLPAMLDNLASDTTEAEVSYDITPRLLIFGGLQTQRRGISQGSDALVEWRFEGQILDEIPTARYYYEQYSLAYKSDAYEDWHSLAWSAEISRIYNSLPIEFLVLLDICDYSFTDFRNVYQIFYQGKVLTMLLDQVKDFRACERLSTPMVFEDFKNLLC